MIADSGEYEVTTDPRAVWAGDRWWKQLIAGGVAGAVSRTCTAPLDRLKTILQAHAAEHNFGFRGGLMYMYNVRLVSHSNDKSTSLRLSFPADFAPLIHFFSQEGGLRSMWRGNLINAIKITPESAIKFFVWDVAKTFIYRTPNDPSQVTAVERLMAGSIAGVTAQASIFPLEVIKVCHYEEQQEGGEGIPISWLTHEAFYLPRPATDPQSP